MSEPDLRRIAEEVARRPRSWPSFRQQVRDEFDRAAERYETRLGPDHLAPLREALRRVEEPRRALDVGCGTGVGAELLAETYPSARVCAMDLSVRMVQAGLERRGARRIRFLVGDAAALPFAGGVFDLVVSIAVPLFAREVARVLAAGGATVAAFPLGETTPIFLSASELERSFRFVGLRGIEHGRAGRGTFTLARKTEAPKGASLG